jgi:glycine cleavage system H lipoate-binding protein
MTCPFLREAQVKFCQAAAVRKLIPLAGGVGAVAADEKCQSAAYAGCRVYQSRPVEDPGFGACPHLAESLMQYCAAAPVAKLVPYSESMLSRCGNDSYRYCELYLSMAHPTVSAEEVDGVPLPDWLHYSANHLWLDVTEDGTCHVGIDAFLSRVLGPVEQVSYVWLQGRHRPAAVLTVAGTDLEVVFPNPLLLTACNVYLRANPARLNTEPYTAGWLFEGRPLPETEENLIDGPQARSWMEQEHRRMNEFLQQSVSPEAGLAADGGMFAPGVAVQLDRTRRTGLFHEFFSPFASGKRDQ